MVYDGLRMEFHVTFEPFPADGLKLVIEGIDKHNFLSTGLPAHHPVNFFLKNEQGVVLGGLLGQIWGRWLHVSFVWVAEQVRSAGHGTLLIKQAEKYAIERGCIGAFLSTFSFQARPFYENLGYRVFATLEGFPPGHSHFHLKKHFASG